MLRRSSLAVALTAALAASLLAVAARGDVASHDVTSAFYIAKSENKNEVHYGVHVDASCVPTGPAPVFAYWRMFERGPQATEPLLNREIRAYGIAEQHVVDRRSDGGRVLLRLRALSARTIAIDTRRRGGTCEATASVFIGGVPATLESVFVQLRWPFGVDHLMLRGERQADGTPIEERLRE